MPIAHVHALARWSMVQRLAARHRANICVRHASLTSTVPHLRSRRLHRWARPVAQRAQQAGGGSGAASGNGAPPPRNLDAIVILAGGLHDDGSLPPWVHRRLDAAADLWAQQSGPCVLLCSGGGTPHKPTVLSKSGYILFESTACASYLMDEKGISAEVILKETSSFDTVGNAYFSMTAHAIPARWRRIGVVTSAFHMPRSRGIFDTICGVAARDMWGDANWYELSFHTASDEGLFEADVYAARVEKEERALQRWHADTGGFTSMAQLHRWLFDTHLCYAVPRQGEFGKPTGLDSKLLASY